MMNKQEASRLMSSYDIQIFYLERYVVAYRVRNFDLRRQLLEKKLSPGFCYFGQRIKVACNIHCKCNLE